MLLGGFIGPKLTEMITLDQFKFAFGWILLVLAGLMFWQTTPGYLQKNKKEQAILKEFKKRAEASAKGEIIGHYKEESDMKVEFWGQEFQVNMVVGCIGGFLHRHHVVNVRLRGRTVYGAVDDRGPAPCRCTLLSAVHCWPSFSIPRSVRCGIISSATST
jgi:hypothetical protein